MQPKKGEKTSDSQVDTNGDRKKPKGQRTALKEMIPTSNRKTHREEAEEAKAQGKREDEPEEEHDSTEGIGKVNRNKRKKTVKVECINGTNLAYNWHAVVARDAGIIFPRA